MRENSFHVEMIPMAGFKNLLNIESFTLKVDNDIQVVEAVKKCAEREAEA